MTKKILELSSYLTNKPEIFFLIFLAFLASILTGVSMLVFYSSFTPLVMGGVSVVLFILSFWFRKPVLAVYVALFFVFLPMGLIPSNIHSLLNRSLTVVAFAIFIVSAFAHRLKITCTLPTYIFIGFLFWSIGTLFWTDNVDRGVIIIQTYFLRLILFLFLIPNLIRDREGIRGRFSGIRDGFKRKKGIA
jgi:hypothetical protein